MTQEQNISTGEQAQAGATAGPLAFPTRDARTMNRDGGLPQDESAMRAAFDALVPHRENEKAHQADLAEKTLGLNTQPTAKPAETKGTADYDKAVKALELDGIPKELLATWKEEDVIRVGLHRSKVHAEVEGKLAGKPTEQPKTEQSNPEVAAAVADVSKAISEEFGEDAGKLLTGFVSQAIEKAGSKLVQTIEQMQGQLMEMHMERLQARLGVTDAGTWNKVVEKMADLSASGKYSSLEALAADAIKLAGAGQPKPADVRSRSAPELPSTRVSPQPQTQDDKDRAKFYELLDTRGR